MSKEKTVLEKTEILFEAVQSQKEALSKLIAHYKFEREQLVNAITRVREILLEAERIFDKAKHAEGRLDDAMERFFKKLKRWEKKYKIHQSAITQIQDFVNDKLGGV